MDIPVESCPSCNYALGDHCFDENIIAGDLVECPTCENTFYVAEVSDGYEELYIFAPTEVGFSFI